MVRNRKLPREMVSFKMSSLQHNLNNSECDLIAPLEPYLVKKTKSWVQCLITFSTWSTPKMHRASVSPQGDIRLAHIGSLTDLFSELISFPIWLSSSVSSGVDTNFAILRIDNHHSQSCVRSLPSPPTLMLPSIGKYDRTWLTSSLIYTWGPHKSSPLYLQEMVPDLQFL